MGDDSTGVRKDRHGLPRGIQRRGGNGEVRTLAINDLPATALQWHQYRSHGIRWLRSCVDHFHLEREHSRLSIRHAGVLKESEHIGHAKGINAIEEGTQGKLQSRVRRWDRGSDGPSVQESVPRQGYKS